MLLGDGWAFIHIPKCGGTSVRSVLQGREYGNVMPMGSHKSPIMSPWHRVPADHLSADMSVFALVRHPVDWLVSFWCKQTPDKCKSYLHQFWDQDIDKFMLKVRAAHPEGYVSTLYDSYIRRVSGCRVYRLEDGIANAIYDATGISVNEPRKNQSESIPSIRWSTAERIIECEIRVIRSYGYENENIAGI